MIKYGPTLVGMVGFIVLSVDPFAGLRFHVMMGVWGLQRGKGVLLHDGLSW